MTAIGTDEETGEKFGFSCQVSLDGHLPSPCQVSFVNHIFGDQVPDENDKGLGGEFISVLQLLIGQVRSEIREKTLQ